MTGLNDLTDFMVLFAFVPAFTFVALYLPRPWWGNPAGRAAMTLSAALTGVLFLIILRRWGTDLPEWVWSAGYASVGAALWLQLGGYITVRWGDDDTRRRVDDVPDPSDQLS